MAPVILELNLFSAQKLLPKPKSLGTYVVAYVDAKKKVSSRIHWNDTVNPTWNDKFVFVLDGERMSPLSTSCLILEIYSARRFKRDKKIGLVHILLQNLPASDKHCLAFLVRNPVDGKPQGIVNVGVEIVKEGNNSFERLIKPSVCAYDYRKLMGNNTHERSIWRFTCSTRFINKSNFKLEVSLSSARHTCR